MAVSGFVILMVMVFGGFAITGGNLTPVFEALPHEMLIIGGAAIASLVISNNMAGLKQLGRALVRIVKGCRYKREDYLAAIYLTVKLMRLLRSDGAIAVEPHIEHPETSDLWRQYPRLLSEHTFVSLVCDTIRLLVVSTGTVSSVAIEDVLDASVETHHRDAMKPVEQLQTLGDGLPALGIVAAVLGVVKTMASIDQPPPILGAMIGSALVGTFLGVLSAYGIVLPMGSRLKQIVEADSEIYHVVSRIILSTMRKQPQPIVLEAARTAIGPENQPTFTEVFEGMRSK